MKRVASLVVLALIALVATAPPAAAAPAGPASGAEAAAPKGKGKGKKGKRPKLERGYPWSPRTKAAVRYARGRAGSVSFALVDARGRIHAFRRGRRYSSGSLVKAMLMVAYLRQGAVKGRRLHASERRLLGPMIRVSDNEAADAVAARVGTGRLSRLARRAGMRRFVPSTAWGGSQITARDQARFFARIRRLTPRRHREYALGLLHRIVPGQRWGIPRAAPRGFRVHFKGGWYPAGGGGWRVHQAAQLRRGRYRLSLAVLTEGGPSLANGSQTIAGVTARLLRRYPSEKR